MRITWLPARRLLRRRGDFRPTEIADQATFEEPHQLSTGVSDVFVNGQQVLQDGEPAAARQGRVVRGPGWKRR